MATRCCRRCGRGSAWRGCRIFESVLDDWAIGAAGLHLLTPPGTLRPARVEALIDFLSERLKRMCGEVHF
jgi:DNA-binding transcriptional LysR family regulator